MNEAEEYIDVLDENGRSTGERELRSQAHRGGSWHRVFHLWVAREDGTVLLQRRARLKEVAPGKVDVTVGGHLLAGETVFDAVREVEEEIGLEVARERMRHLGTWRTELRQGELIDREHQEVFALINDWPLEQYSLDCSEVEVLYELPLARALDLYRSGVPVPAPGFDCQQRVNNALLIDDDLIEPARLTTLAQLEALAGWLGQADQTPRPASPL